MEKHKLHVNVSRTEDNFCGYWIDGQNGVVLVTAKTFSKFKDDMAESIRLHIKGCIADGDSCPEDLVNGDYNIEYTCIPEDNLGY